MRKAIVLTRKIREKLVIATPLGNVTVKLLQKSGNYIRLRIFAHEGIGVYRSEVMNRPIDEQAEEEVEW